VTGAGDADVETVLSGALAPPMANGEVLFDAPWQGRAFGMAHSLARAGVYDWDEFRAHLIAVIGGWEREASDDTPYQYYDHFLEALERVLAEKGILDAGVLSERMHVLAARPHGHDH